MSEKKIVVPEEMLEEVFRFSYDYATAYECVPSEKQQLEAALRWLSEHPIIPNDEQLLEFRHSWDDIWGKTQEGKGDFLVWALVEWQRRMFLAPEPEVPENPIEVCKKAFDAFGDEFFATRGKPSQESLDCLFKAMTIMSDEAYRRGQKGQHGR